MKNRTSLTRSLAAPSVSCQVERPDYSHITPRSNHSQLSQNSPSPDFLRMLAVSPASSLSAPLSPSS